MSQLTGDDIARLAYLARLKLSSDELQNYTEEINRILEYVQKLSAVDTEGLEPTSQVTGLTNVARKDVVQKTLELDQLMKNIPKKLDGHIKVNRMIV